MKSATATTLYPNRRRFRGFQLLEVLIAFALFSVGALALGSLQIRSKQAAYEAVQRTLASDLTNDIIERMRMNAAVGLVDYVSASGSRIFHGTTRPAAPATDADCSNSSVLCTSAQLAAYDLYNWYERVRGSTDQQNGSYSGGLVDPTVCLSGPGTGISGTYTVTIVWRGQKPQNDTNADTCGQGNYDTGLRRLLAIDTYIANQ